MPKKISDIRKSILKPVPAEHLKDRAGPGNKRLHYVEGDYVTFQLNDVFGVECVDITIPHHGLEGETRFKKSVQTKAAFNKETRTYEEVETKDLPAVEYSYGAKVRIAVTVLDDQGAERIFVKEGIGAGLGSSAATEFSSLHQARQIAMKYAETDALKRAAKKIGTLFGLSIGEDGSQAYAIDEDDTVEDIVAPEASGTTPAPSSVLSNESSKPTAQQAAPTSAPATQQPQATKPVAQPSAIQPQTQTAAPTQPPAPKAPAQPAATQTQPPATKAPVHPPVEQKAAPIAATQQAAAAAPATEPGNETGTARVAIPKVDESALRSLGSLEWTNTFRLLKTAMSQTTAIEDVSEVARIAGCYFRLVNASEFLEESYKKQVKPLMTNHLLKHVSAHALQIDVAAEIQKGEEPPVGIEEEAFQAPF